MGVAVAREIGKGQLTDQIATGDGTGIAEEGQAGEGAVGPEPVFVGGWAIQHLATVLDRERPRLTFDSETVESRDQQPLHPIRVADQPAGWNTQTRSAGCVEEELLVLHEVR